MLFKREELKKTEDIEDAFKKAFYSSENNETAKDEDTVDEKGAPRSTVSFSFSGKEKLPEPVKFSISEPTEVEVVLANNAIIMSRTEPDRKFACGLGFYANGEFLVKTDHWPSVGDKFELNVKETTEVEVRVEPKEKILDKDLFLIELNFS